MYMGYNDNTILEPPKNVHVTMSVEIGTKQNVYKGLYSIQN